MNVFVLHHVHKSDRDDEDIKLIGIYTSEEKAREAMARLSTLPGFSENPDGFNVDIYEMDKDYWAEGFVTVTS